MNMALSLFFIIYGKPKVTEIKQYIHRSLDLEGANNVSAN